MGGDKPLTFIRQSIRNFRSTGALAPSGQFLARAVAKILPEKMPDQYSILEVGPGTGSVTVEILRRMNGSGRLDLWEISPEFCQVLCRRMSLDPVFKGMKSRIAIHEGDVRKVAPKPCYDAIVSGLPFSNFEPDEVRGIMEHFKAVLKPGGVLIWFDYVAIRKLQAPFVSRARRVRLKTISSIIDKYVREHQVRQQIIPINLPPARIRQLKFG
jgi:phospholipid N-methyltransferase